MVNYDLHRDFYKVPLIECEITKMLYEILRKNFSEKQFDICITKISTFLILCETMKKSL